MSTNFHSLVSCISMWACWSECFASEDDTLPILDGVDIFDMIIFCNLY